MDGISLNVGEQVLGAVNVAMLKKTQDIAAEQVLQLVQSIPRSPNGAGVGANIDVSA